MNMSFSGEPKDSQDIIERMIAGAACSVEVAIKQARIHNTQLICWKDGKIIEVDPFSIKLEIDKN